MLSDGPWHPSSLVGPELPPLDIESELILQQEQQQQEVSMRLPAHPCMRVPSWGGHVSSPQSVQRLLKRLREFADHAHSALLLPFIFSYPSHAFQSAGQVLQQNFMAALQLALSWDILHYVYESLQTAGLPRLTHPFF